MKHTLSYTIIIGTTILLQMHSISFWRDVSGYESGLVYSLMIEAVAIYFWYNKHEILATSASLVVVGSALFSLASGSIDLIEDKKVESEKEKQLKVLTETLDSIKDKKYPITIQKTMKQMELLRNSMSETVVDKKEPMFITWIKIIVQAFALVLIMLAQILAITKVRVAGTTSPKKENTEHEAIKAEQPKKKARNAVLNSENAELARELLQLIEKKRLELGYLTRNKFIVTVIVDEKPLNKNVPTKLGYVMNGDINAYSLSKMKLVKEAIETL